MPAFRVNQIRSGEGWILTDPQNVGVEAMASELADLLVGPLVIASEDFETWTPPGGEQLEAHVFAFLGDAAKAMLRDWKRWGGRRAIVACFPSLPDADARRRFMPDALRPWDPDRMKATFYAQLGKDWAQQGTWFAKERDRARFVETAVKRVLDAASVRLPNGDVTIVFEMPTDSTFEAKFDVSGSGDSLRIKRDFPSRMLSREWFVNKGEWEAVERKSSARASKSLKQRALSALATTGIVVMSIPVFCIVAVAAVIAKLTGASTTVSTSAKTSR